MYQEERIQQMQQLLEERKRLSKKEIMEAFQISSDTARRDILEFFHYFFFGKSFSLLQQLMHLLDALFLIHHPTTFN